MQVSYYDILNVSFTASLKQIKDSFRKLAKQYHPDLCTDDLADRKLRLIVEAYEVLGNKTLKLEYDKKFVHKNLVFHEGESYVRIPKIRVDYVGSLMNLAKSGLLAEKKVKRKQRLASFGYDVSISITPGENKRGTCIAIPLPAKELCRVCFGEDRSCYLCEGLGRYSTVHDLELLFPPNVEQNSLFDVDLSGYMPDNLGYFTLNHITIRIHILGTV